MRTLLLTVVACAVCGACAGRQARPLAAAPHAGADAARSAAPQPSPAPLPTLEPAPSPGEAVERSLRAQAEGDEAAYRRVVVFRPPGNYMDVSLRAQFAGARLHRAVRERGVTGRRVRHSGFDANEMLTVREPITASRLAAALHLLRQTEWDVRGDVAVAAAGSPLARMSDNGTGVERLGDGWVVVVSGPAAGADSDSARESLKGVTIRADAVDAATAEVRAGRLRTIREVNDFIDARVNAATDFAVAEVKAAPPAGPEVLVTDVETGRPVAGATVSGRFIVAGRVTELPVTTDEGGRARLLVAPDDWHSFTVDAEGYASIPSDVSFGGAGEGEGGDSARSEIRLKIGGPVVVEVLLVLPDERRAAMSVYEGESDRPAPPGLRDRLELKRLTIPMTWAADPPALPRYNPMLLLDLAEASPHHGQSGVVHRVSRVQTPGGRELPLFRTAPPADAKTFGVYEIGRNIFGHTVFVIGTLTDARATADAAANARALEGRNDRVLGR